jgi:hypothetical protein
MNLAIMFSAAWAFRDVSAAVWVLITLTGCLLLTRHLSRVVLSGAGLEILVPDRACIPGRRLFR